MSRITTDIQSGGECFTDSNAREMQRRRRDFRPTWSLNQTEPVSGNYFPVVAAAFIRDERKQLTILTDASQAGSGCVRDGELEMMVHRRLLVDDVRGLNDVLNETEFVEPWVGPEKTRGRLYGPGLITRGKHFWTVGAPSTAAQVWRPLVDAVYMPLQPFFAGAASELGSSTSSFLLQPLPPNVQIVTLEAWDDSRTLLRLAHQFGLGEDAALSQPATIDLRALFAHSEVKSVDERGLAVTISRDEVLRRRIQWRAEGDVGSPPQADESKERNEFQVTLGPLQIRTFLLELAPRVSAVIV